MSKLRTRKGMVAIKPLPLYKKPEVRGGSFATIAQKHEVIAVGLAMDYELDGVVLRAGIDKVILPADANLQPWSNKRLSLGETDFVLCPEQQLVGYVIGSE